MAPPETTSDRQVVCRNVRAPRRRSLPIYGRSACATSTLRPIFRPRPGSEHGYDVVDPSRVSADLGGELGHAAYRSALAAHGLGEVLDVVPNHMAISGAENPWWWDVLENGPASRFAGYFDVDWDPPEARLRNVVLLPVLGDHYGRLLEAGEIRLERRIDADFCARYGERIFPPTELFGTQPC